MCVCSQAADIKVEVPTMTILTSQLLGHLYDGIYVFRPSVDGDTHVSGEKGLPPGQVPQFIVIRLSSDFDEHKTILILTSSWKTFFISGVASGNMFCAQPITHLHLT